MTAGKVESKEKVRYYWRVSLGVMTSGKLSRERRVRYYMSY